MVPFFGWRVLLYFEGELLVDLVEELAAELVLQLALDVSLRFLVPQTSWFDLGLGVLWVQGLIYLSLWTVGLLDLPLLSDEGFSTGVSRQVAKDLRVPVDHILQRSLLLSRLRESELTIFPVFVFLSFKII